ncbi:MAG: TPM domain-containing protein, partial [Pseudomonadota bacterium]
AAFPKPAGFVNDFAGVMSAGSKSKVEGLLSSFEKSTGIEVAVATLPSLEGRTVEDVAVDLYKEWGIGKKGKDNGALFLVAPNERKVRIEVGYGLEGVLNDALTGRIIDDYVVPRFRAGEVSDGITAGTVAIVRTIADKEGIAFDTGSVDDAGVYTEIPDPPPEHKKGGPLRTAGKVLFVIFLIYLFIRHPWLFLLVLNMSGGGRGGGGFGGGGFGGFGGGMSGGGGSSRSW